jgi:hypothetical protein
VRTAGTKSGTHLINSRVLVRHEVRIPKQTRRNAPRGSITFIFATAAGLPPAAEGEVFCPACECAISFLCRQARRGRSISCQRRTKAQPTQPTLLMHARVDRGIIRKSEETSNKDQHIAASSLALHVAQLGMDRVFFMDFFCLRHGCIAG